MAKLTGTNPDQVPTNADLGTMAYQDKDNLQVGDVYANGILKSDQGAGHIIVKHDGVNGSISNNTGQLLMYAEGAGSIINHTNGVERMRIDSAGNVGIGTQSPAVAFHVDDNSSGEQARISSSSTNGATLGFRSTSTNGRNYRIGSNFVTGQGEFSIYDDSAGAERIRIDNSGEVQVPSGLLELDGNDIGGTQVTIADDAVASITPPRKGGFMFITDDGNGSFPSTVRSGFVFYDVGGSLNIQKQTTVGTVGDSINVSTSDVTGTTGIDGFITVAVQTGVIKIENRAGSSKT